MTTALPPRPGPDPTGLTVEQFHHLGELGLFEGRRTSLINGVVIEEGPMNPPHAIAGTKTEDLIRDVFGRGWHVRVQKPLVVGQTTDPEPDVAVVRGRPGDYTTHPTAADLVIEISDTSLAHDTTTKAELYTAAGIADYWVLDMVGRQLHVFRDPVPLPQGLGATAYRTHLVYAPTDAVSPLAVPAAAVPVADLLP